MRKIKFAFGTHNHQPVGNFDFVFEDAYNKAYLPFIELLEKHPKIKITQHYTGILFDWLLKHRPECITRLQKLVNKGQVEIMTGGFYEPILINISDDDKYGQINKLTEFIKEHTKYNPTGLWLAERIWEPQLASILSQANIRYTIIDDSHFKSAGLRAKDLHGYYITEDKGETLNIFPIDEKLRYTIPFQDPEVTIDYFRSLATEDGNNLVVFADDGEKFGVWPETYKHCYSENHWLERFFNILEENLDWIEVIHFNDALDNLLPLGNVYLPTASYREMMEWALPVHSIHEYENFENTLKSTALFDQSKVFVRGGFWRNFLAKYPESNNLHKKSIYVSKKISTLEKDLKNNKILKKAKDHLWAAECNCPYWHGIFGGLYLNHLRYAVYNNMIKAEALIDKLCQNESQYSNGWINQKIFDFNANGRKELLIETKPFNLYFSPDSGGSLFEMDYKPKAINLLDTMSRHEESYHQKLKNADNNNNHNDGISSIHDLIILKEKDLDKKLYYDWYRRSSLLDHFLGPDTELESIITSKYQEVGDFINSNYNFECTKENDTLNILLSREGSINYNDNNKTISLKKTIQIHPKNTELIITYQIQNLDQSITELWFAIEFNIALLAGNAPDRYYYFPNYELENRNLASKGIVKSVKEMGLKDEWIGLDVNFNFSKPTNLWRYPIETISQSEGGFECVYQSSVILPNWKFELKPGELWEIKINKKINNLH